MVKAEANDPDQLLEALKAGHHYSTQGPALHGLTYEDRFVTVESSAVASVIIQGQGSASASVHGESMTRTRVNIDRLANSPWMRVSVIDRAGKRAWLNPHWREDD